MQTKLFITLILICSLLLGGCSFFTNKEVPIISISLFQDSKPTWQRIDGFWGSYEAKYRTNFGTRYKISVFECSAGEAIEFFDITMLSEKVLKKTSTKQLIETYLSLPFTEEMFKCSKPDRTPLEENDDFFNNVLKPLALTKELLTRNDAGKKVFEKYSSLNPINMGNLTMPINNDDWSLGKESDLNKNFMYLEMLLAQKEIISQFSPEEKMQIIKRLKLYSIRKGFFNHTEPIYRNRFEDRTMRNIMLAEDFPYEFTPEMFQPQVEYGHYPNPADPVKLNEEQLVRKHVSAMLDGGIEWRLKSKGD